MFGVSGGCFESRGMPRKQFEVIRTRLDNFFKNEKNHICWDFRVFLKAFRRLHPEPTSRVNGFGKVEI